jgi:peptide/nickel transport system permease protein
VRRFIAARLAQAAILIVLVTVVSFFLMHLVPGDPFGYEGSHITPAVRAHWREAFGYNRPIPVQLGKYLANVAHGNFGYSTMQRRPAAAAIADALPRTLELALVGLVASIILGVVLGAIAAARRASWWDRWIVAGCTVALSIPEFWLALLLQLGFGFRLGWFPISGTSDPLTAEYGSRGAAFLDRLSHLVLPGLTIAILVGAIVARLQRSALLDVLPSDYLRTARAKGASERAIIGRHALRNALTPTITILGYLFPTILGGVFFVEYVFSWGGLGQLSVIAVQALDYDVAIGCVIVAGVLVVIGNLLADLLVAVVDPRVRDA